MFPTWKCEDNWGRREPISAKPLVEVLHNPFKTHSVEMGWTWGPDANRLRWKCALCIPKPRELDAQCDGRQLVLRSQRPVEIEHQTPDGGVHTTILQRQPVLLDEHFPTGW